MLLVGFKDPVFEMTTNIKRNKYDNTLMQYVIAIQKQYREVTNKGSIEIKFRNKMRCVCEEDG